MNELIKSIAEVGILTTISGATIYLLFKYFEIKIRKCKIGNPKNHSFFTQMQYNRLIKVNNIKIYKDNQYCENRTNLFKKMIQIKLKHWDEEMRKLVNEDYRKMNNRELLEMFSKSIIRIIKNYESEWKENKISQLVIDKFNSWHQPHVEMFGSAVHNICMGTSFNGQEEQMNAVLELHNALLVITVLDTEKTLGTLNGELTKYFNEN